jgi:hypothetical protein
MTAGAIVTSIVGMAVAQTAGQDAAPNPALTLDTRFGLSGDDDEVALRTGLGLEYVTRTRDQALRFTLDTDVDFGEDGLDRDAFLPDARVRYAFDNETTLLTFSARYTVREVEGIGFLLDGEAVDIDAGVDDLDQALIDGDDLERVEDDGRLVTTSADLGLQLFRRAPVGLEFGADVLRRDYRDTTDPELDDSEAVGFGGALRLTPRPGLDFRLTAQRSELTDEDQLDSETTIQRYGARVDWQATPGTALALGLTRIEREEERNAFVVLGDRVVLTGQRETIDNSGLGVDAAITQARPNGTRALTFSRRLTDESAILELGVARALDLPNGGRLEAGIGWADFEDGGDTLTGRLAYSTQLAPNLGVQARLTRTAGTNSEDQNIALTRGALTLTRRVTPTARVGLDMALARRDVIDGFQADQTNGSVGLNYEQALTPDWALSARYTHAASRTSGEDTERENRFSISVGRSFTFRP